jgi:hypothetical protein
LTADLFHEYRLSRQLSRKGTVMDYLKHRSADWWIMRVLEGLGFAACLLLIILLFTFLG